MARTVNRRRKKAEQKANHDRWLVSYADFITLLFAFFVVMYSVSQVNESKYRTLSETLSSVFKVRDGQAIGSSAANLQLPDMEALAEEIRAALRDLVERRRISVQATEQWVEISVNASLLFASGSAEPGPEARRVFQEIARLLKPYNNAIDVSGHTDNQPINNHAFSNNWELSSARATAVVELLNTAGIAPERLSATGYGEFRPVADNTTEAGRAANRRVALMVARREAERPQVSPEALTEALREDEAQLEQRPQPGTMEPNEAVTPGEPLEPIRRDDGSLLFTSDPDARETDR